MKNKLLCPCHWN